MVLTGLATLGAAQEAAAQGLHPSMAAYAPWLLAPVTQPPPADALTVRFMGVTSVLLEREGRQLLVDGFVSRPRLLRAALPLSAPDRGRLNEALARSAMRDLSGVLVLQGHHDHAMDAAEFAKARGGTLVGSASTVALARARGFMGPTQALSGRETIGLDGFQVDALPSPHSRPNLFKGAMSADIPRRTSMWRYRDDENYSFLIASGSRQVLMHGSAGLPIDCLTGVCAEVVFLSVASIRPEDFPAYWEHAVRKTGARLVIPVHWDNFFRPLDEGLRILPSFLGHARRGLDLALAQAERDGIAIGLLPPFAQVVLPTDGPPAYLRGSPPPKRVSPDRPQAPDAPATSLSCSST